MYTSSDGAQKSVSDINSEYVLNALNKAQREIFNSTSIDEYNKHLNNIQILREELDKRIQNFINSKIESGEI